MEHVRYVRFMDIVPAKKKGDVPLLYEIIRVSFEGQFPLALDKGLRLTLYINLCTKSFEDSLVLLSSFIITNLLLDQRWLNCVQFQRFDQWNNLCQLNYHPF